MNMSTEIFINRVTSLIKNLIINNKNYHGAYFHDQSKFGLRDATIERGKLILEHIECTKHLLACGGVLEEIIDSIKEHNEKYPTHGVGCACMDEHCAKLRCAIHKQTEHDRKAYSSLLRILNSVANNP